MKFLFRWLGRKLKEANENKLAISLERDYPGAVGATKGGSRNLDSRGTTFNLYKADGGMVVETTSVDKNHDYYHNLYIITSDQDLGERLEHILTYEELKR